tara:strand:+ start:5616 stop:8936 length:3321 start_codon:yes stop_codon:yes gene_type:complete
MAESNTTTQTRISSAFRNPTHQDMAQDAGYDTSYFVIEGHQFAGYEKPGGSLNGILCHQYGAQEKLESVSVYQVTDALCEGEIDGLAYKNGEKILFSNQGDSNIEPLKGVFLNDVPVVNDIGTFNYNRLAGQFDTGRATPELFRSQPPSQAGAAYHISTLSKYCNFYNSWQTLNIGAKLVGFTHSETMAYFRKAFGGVMESSLYSGGRGVKGSISGFTVPQLLVGTNQVNTIAEADTNANAPFNHYITSDNIHAIKIRIQVDALGYTDDELKKAQINFVIAVGYADDPYYIDKGGSVKYFLGSIYGKLTSPYIRNYFVDLPPSYNNQKRFIRVFAISSEPGPENFKLQRSAQVLDISEICLDKFNWPNTSMATTIFDARAFTQPPKRTYHLRMKKINVPSNYDPETREYFGNWNGKFDTEKKWTDNPAWIFYDLATNTRYGAGKFGFADYFIDKWNLYKIAKFCDELVPTGYINPLGEFDYTVGEGDSLVTVTANNSKELSLTEWRDIFPNGGIAVFTVNRDSNGNALESAFIRHIISGSISSGAVKSNQYSFKIAKVPVASTVFKKYTDLKQKYLDEVNSLPAGTSMTPFYYLQTLITTAANNLNSSDPFLKEYLAPFPLDVDVVAGKVTRSMEGDNKNLLEPRFRCNLYFDKRQSAVNALNDIASIFRGIVYYTNSYIFASSDRSTDTIMVFTNANVEDGSFVYTGSALTSRSTVAVVRYNDENEDYKPKIEYLENPAGLRDYGYKEKDVIALGVTSQSQAKRLAKWLLYTDQTENDVVQFTTGQEATYLRPGDVVEIQDKLKTVKRYGGRVVDVDYASRTITIDEGIEEGIIGQQIAIVTPKSNLSPTQLNNLSIDLPEGEGVPQSTIDSSRTSQISVFTIGSIEDTNKITISETESEDFNLIQKGYIWSAYNLDSAYDIKPIKYRVLTVTESNSNSYSVTCMLYNKSKFEAIEGRGSLERTQASSQQMFQNQTRPLPLQSVTGVNVLTNKILINPREEAANWDAKFRINDTNTYRNDYRYTILTIDFSQLVNAQSPSISPENTGGYILEVSKGTGEKIRVTLDGYDTTEAEILFGTDREFDKPFSVDIFRYAQNKVLEQTEL